MSADAPVFVAKGTPAWDAWLAATGRADLPTVVLRPVDGEPVEGWFFPSLTPPAADEPEGGE